MSDDGSLIRRIEMAAEAAHVELTRRERASTADEAAPRDAELGLEYGYAQNMPFTAWWTNDTMEVLSLELEPTIQQLVEMRREDGQARGLFNLITLPIRSALRGATFAPAEGGEKEADFITQMFTLPPNAGGMTVTFQQFMAHLLQAIFYGFTAFEQVYWRPTKGPLKGKYTMKKLAYRPSESITFLTDDNGGFNGIKQRINTPQGFKEIEIPRERALYYAVNEEERRFYGISMFHTAYYHFDKKKKLYFIAHLAAQRAAVGTRLGTMPKSGVTPAQKAEFKRALADLGLAQSIAFPEGFKVEVVREGGSFNFLEIINHHQSQMSKSVLGGFFDKDQGGDSALVNFGTQSDAHFMMMLQTLMDEIAALINHYLVPKFIDWNFGTEKYPQFRWGAFTDEDKVTIRGIFDRLSAAGQSAAVSPEFVLEIEKLMAKQLGLEIDYAPIEERMEKQIEQAEAMPADDPASGMPITPGTDPTGSAGPGQPTPTGSSSTDGEMSPEDLRAALEAMSGE